MSDEAWNAGFVKCLGVRLAGDLIGDVDVRGEPIVGDTLLLLLNAHHEPLPFQLPLTKEEQHWERLLDTADPADSVEQWDGEKLYQLKERSLAVLRTRVAQEATVPEQQVETILKSQERLPQAKPAGMLAAS